MTQRGSWSRRTSVNFVAPLDDGPDGTFGGYARQVRVVTDAAIQGLSTGKDAKGAAQNEESGRQRRPPGRRVGGSSRRGFSASAAPDEPR